MGNVRPKKTLESLPKPLQYLQPFVRFLARLTPDQLNEDLDFARLESALRKRLRGLDEQAGVEAVSKDREQLERWLKTSASPGHPAHYVFGVLTYLSVSDVVQQLIRPPEPPPPGPTISVDAPDGWKITRASYNVSLKKGKLFAMIMAIDKFSFQGQQKQKQVLEGRLGEAGAPGLQATFDIKRIRFGDVAGNKFVYRQSAPVPWKRVECLLRVPGGFVFAVLDAGGTNFDEAPFESKLHTLRLTVPP
jgi:hypothetical protein